jgi:large exoprotein involved in heme utilization and adhesion
VASPAAFGFLTQNPARIAIQGSELGVSTGETLSIVGGAIEIVGRGVAADDFAELSAPSGLINIASVASPGEVTLNAPGGNPDVDMHSFARLGEIALSQNVTVSVAGDPGGTVVIRSGHLTMDDTRITAATRGDTNHSGIGIDVHVTGDMILNGPAEIASSSFGAGDAGDVRIVAGSLQLIGNPSLRLGSNIGSRAFGAGDNAGNAGDIKITTESLLMQNGAGIETATFGPGAGGNILIEAGHIQMLGLQRFALISTGSFGSGDAGNMAVRAERVLLHGGVEGFTGLATQVSPQAQAEATAGLLRLITDRLEVRDGAQISAIVFTGSGRGGDIEVTAGTMIIAGTDPEGNPAGIFANTEGGSRTTGNGGDIRITAKDMRLADRGQISAFSASLGNSGNIYIQTGDLQVTHGSFLSSANIGAGAAGDIEIYADSIHLAGPSPEGGATGLFSFGTIFAQAAGDIRITVGTLEILDGAHISSRTTGPGNGGTIEIRAQRVHIEGSDPGSASFDGPQAGIFASTLIFQDFVDQATGQAGDIRIQAGALELHDQGTIRTLSASAGDGGIIEVVAERLTLTSGASMTAESTGKGDAGNIHLTATNTLLSENSTITTAAKQTDGGNILVTAPSLIRLRGSEISATVGGGPETVGGNITIDPEFVIMENSQIRANAFAGRGGTVQITAGVFLADPTSQVSASSTLGIDGQVDIQAPVTNLSGVVSPLPSGFAPATALLYDRCAARLQEGTVSSLVKRGRDGMPAAPDGVLPGILDGGRQARGDSGKKGGQPEEASTSHRSPWKVDANGSLQIRRWPTRDFSQAATAWPCSSQ